MKSLIQQNRKLPLVLACAWAVSACGGSSDGEPHGQGGNTGSDGSRFASTEEYFNAEVKPQLAFCRTCHVPGGVADTDKGERFMLSRSGADDYEKTRAAWQVLGEGVESNRILTKASNTDAELHSGGAPWAMNGPAYNAMKTVLQCWDNPEGCNNLVGGGGAGELPPLLGNPGKHFFVNQLCDGAPDDTPIDWSRDPRRLLQNSGFEGSADLIDSEEYAVHFNDPYEVCHTETLFETQARQNELREAQGTKPIYSAKRDPATCGEWRAAVQRGHDWIAMTPTDQPLHGNHADGLFGTGLNIFGDATAWNNLWKVWGMPGRPDNFDEQLFERYGHTPPPDHIHNPYPLPGEENELSDTFGGTGRLPLGFAQGRDENGNYTGTLGLTCFSCHAGQIGSGEAVGRDGNVNTESYGANQYGSYMGLPNTNTELGVLLVDLLNAQQYQFPGAEQNPLRPPAFGYIPLVNTTRGTNAADTEIEAIVAVRDFDTLNFQRPFAYPLHPNMGDQDPPAWWWLSNKTRYLWFGGHSTDSARGNMYFGSVNTLSGDEVKENEGVFEDVHQWTLTVEAPDYPQGFCSGEDGGPAAGDKPGCINRPLAEQGAVLFHEKDLWADDANSDIPRPKGNGACAGCHGAYSPRYINDERFLPTPELAGVVGYTVPIEIIDTDPAQAEGWTMPMREHVSTFWWSYPDAVEGYRLPEEKDPLSELLDDYAFLGVEGSDIADQLRRHLDRSGALQPLGDGLTLATDALLGAIPELPFGEAMGRIKGACGFEEKTVGYVTPPLHGVWASAPYFHNGSVPNIWGILKPEERPRVWRRQRAVTDVHFNQFETRISGANSGYDWQKLGWNYQEVKCGDGGMGIPFYTCDAGVDVPQEIQWGADALLGGILWPTWVVPPPFDTQGLEDRMVYNTLMYSKKNRGHEWTRVLTDTERRAILEYLKTL